jgi:hypothetical protein
VPGVAGAVAVMLAVPDPFAVVVPTVVVPIVKVTLAPGQNPLAVSVKELPATGEEALVPSVGAAGGYADAVIGTARIASTEIRTTIARFTKSPRSRLRDEPEMGPW